MVKMSTELIGLMNMMLDWRHQCRARVYADSTAALGVVNRKGSGKLRHVRVGMLWIQGKREDGSIEYTKVGGADNPGDLMTKSLAAESIQNHVKRMFIDVRGGRADASLHLSSIRKRRRRKRFTGDGP